MGQMAAFEVMLIAAVLFGVVMGWDGLVRRHIRVDIDGFQLHLRLRGLSAILVGSASVLISLLFARVAIQQLWLVAAACQTAICLVQALILPVLTTWPAVVALLILFLPFALWLSQAGDLRGPYHRRPLALGVWDDEKEIVTLVRGRLEAAQLPAIDEDVIIDVASWVHQNIGLLGVFARRAIVRQGEFDAGATVESLVSMRAAERFHLTDPTLRVILRAIVEYYIDLYTRVTTAYPWGRRAMRRMQRGRRDRGAVP